MRYLVNRSLSIIIAGAWSQSPRQVMGSKCKPLVSSCLPENDPQFPGNMIINRVITHDHATDAVANQDHMPANRLTVYPAIKSSHTIHLSGDISQEFSNITYRFIRNPSPVLLHDLQCIETGEPEG
jgi:hypothetical protein